MKLVVSAKTTARNGVLYDRRCRSKMKELRIRFTMKTTGLVVLITNGDNNVIMSPQC